MHTKRLGDAGPTVSALGLGAMGMSDFYGPADEAESTATLHAALDAGVTLIDTGDFYGSGHNEMLVGRAIRDRRSQVFLQVKFGALRTPDGGFSGYDARPAAVKNFLTMSLKRLGTDYIDLYMPSRVDPEVPIEDTVGAVKEMIGAGYVRHLGLSEANAETIRRAHAVHPVTALQTEYSLFQRDPETKVRPVLDEIGAGLTAYGVLSRGLLGSAQPAAGAQDYRSRLPRFQGKAYAHNLDLAERVGALASERGVSRAQLAIAWALHRGDTVVPLVGARTRARLEEALGALDVTLTAEDLAALDAAVPPGAVQGDRYPAPQMAALQI